MENIAQNLVGIKQLRENIDAYIAQVNRGKSFIILRRSKPIFKISPPVEEEIWEPVIDFTRIRRGGIDINELLSRL